MGWWAWGWHILEKGAFIRNNRYLCKLGRVITSQLLDFSVSLDYSCEK